jgi:hypothetical protein
MLIRVFNETSRKIFLDKIKQSTFFVLHIINRTGNIPSQHAPIHEVVDGLILRCLLLLVCCRLSTANELSDANTEEHDNKKESR